jgi:hypothetical protein
MKGWQFFGNPSDCGDVVEMLRWRIAIRQAEASIFERRLRDCELVHVAWMESECRGSLIGKTVKRPSPYVEIPPKP